jgi:hypothetical protein
MCLVTYEFEIARRDTRRPPPSPSEVMRGQIIKVSVSLAVLMTSTASLFVISWVGLALLGF